MFGHKEVFLTPRLTPREALESGLAALGLSLEATAVERLLGYLEELARWNRAYNLTAVRQPLEMVRRHLLDSLMLVSVVQGSVIDVGSGAGLPGLPLAIVAPERSVTVLDSNGKKARFLRHAVRTLALDNVEVAETRAEVWQPTAGYDFVVSRAFARLSDFLAMTGHLAAEGGQWLAMKGKLEARELAEVPEGFHIVDVKTLSVPGLPEARHLVIVSRA